MTTLTQKELEELETCPMDDIVGFNPETIDGRGDIEGSVEEVEDSTQEEAEALTEE